MVLKLGELCGSMDDALRQELTVKAGFLWTMSACSLMKVASFVLGCGADDRGMKVFLKSEGVAQVLSVGVCCGNELFRFEAFDELRALSGFSIAGVLDEEAKHVLQRQREGRWEDLSQAQVMDVIAGRMDQLLGLMRGPFAMWLELFVLNPAKASSNDPVLTAMMCTSIASVAALRAAYAAAKPLLDGMALLMPAGQPLLCAVACCNVFCSKGGPALRGGGEAWVGPSNQPFCSRACLAAHVSMCKG